MTPTPPPADSRREARIAAVYAAVYIAWLFVYPEGELVHWLTLVAIPVAGLWWLRGRPAWRTVPALVGLARSNWRGGMAWALGLGASFQGLQLLNRPQRLEVLSALAQPGGWLLPLAAFVLLVATVATTEEVFFRGVLQARIAAGLGREWLALVVTVVVFIAYHVPYAYLKPSWPSAGDLGAAVQLAAANGGIGGAALGLVWWRGRGNLAACILLHALIDLVPAIRLVERLNLLGP